MINSIPKKLLLGFMEIHILIKAKKDPFFGLGMISELENYGYNISPGTIYPLLSKLEKKSLVKKESKLVNGKNRKYYSITEEGLKVLDSVKQKALVLLKELEEI